MPKFVVMFPADNEAEWEAGSAADHRAVFDVDAEFALQLRAHGGEVTGGAGLAHSRTGRTLRPGPDSTCLVTDGPFAESVEQISGFYQVTSPDIDAVIQAAQVLTTAHPVVEIRPVEED